MRMDEIGYHHSHGPEFLIDRPNGSGDWLFLLTHTPVIVRMNGEDIRVPEPSFIIYTPNCPQYYYTDPDYGKHLDDWIHFGFSKEEEALAHTLGIPFDKPIHLGQATILSKYVQNTSSSSLIASMEGVGIRLLSSLEKFPIPLINCNIIKYKSFIEKS